MIDKRYYREATPADWKAFRTASRVFIITGILIAIAWACLTAWFHTSISGQYYETTGTVLYNNEDWTTSSKTHRSYKTYAPVYEYTVDGKQYQGKSRTYSNIKVYEQGESIKIFVNKQNPLKSMQGADMTTWYILQIALPAMSIIWFIVAYIFQRVSKSYHKKYIEEQGVIGEP